MAEDVLFFEQLEPIAQLGDRARGLVQLARLGLPVPPGFIVPLDVVRRVGDGDRLHVALMQLKARIGTYPPTVALRSTSRGQAAGRAILDLPMDDARVVREAMLGMSDGAESVIVQHMISADAWGRAFTRNPKSGERRLSGVLMFQRDETRKEAALPLSAMQAQFPDAYRDLETACRRLEADSRDMRRVDFAVAGGALHLLGTRDFRLRSQAAVRAAVDMACEGLITRREALMRVWPADVGAAMQATFVAAEAERAERAGFLIGRGTGVNGGVTWGSVVFDGKTARRAQERGQRAILMCERLLPGDREEMRYLSGLVAASGTSTSSAALAAHRWGWPCVVGCETLKIDAGRRRVSAGSRILREGDIVTIDGQSGRVFAGGVNFHAPPGPPAEVTTLLEWADEVSRMRVRAKAETPPDLKMAGEYGAQGVGLCRIECILFQPEHLPVFRDALRRALRGEAGRVFDDLERCLTDEIYRLFEVVAVTAESGSARPFLIRLLDAPLHQFLPRDEVDEVNPMLGLRWCRLSIKVPGLLDLQIRAILGALLRLEAACKRVRLQIMLPGVSSLEELRHVRRRIGELARPLADRHGAALRFEVGSILELPRACFIADQLAADADFLSFGTNDLTQAMFGYSREDAHYSFLPAYLDLGIVPQDPFLTLDADGVGAVMRVAVERARSVKPNIEIGMCGDHGADPQSVALAHDLGLDYVSSYPWFIPAARLAAAQAALGRVDTP